MSEPWPLVATGSSVRRALRDPGPLAVSLAFYAIVATVLATLWRTAAVGHAGEIAGVTFTQVTETSLRAVVDTTVRPIKAVLDAVLVELPVTDISVTDPPLEQVIAEIYAMPST